MTFHKLLDENTAVEILKRREKELVEELMDEENRPEFSRKVDMLCSVRAALRRYEENGGGK